MLRATDMAPVVNSFGGPLVDGPAYTHEANPYAEMTCAAQAHSQPLPFLAMGESVRNMLYTEVDFLQEAIVYAPSSPSMHRLLQCCSFENQQFSLRVCACL